MAHSAARTPAPKTERFIECHRPAFASAAFRHGDFVAYDFMIFLLSILFLRPLKSGADPKVCPHDLSITNMWVWFTALEATIAG
jgi:hypothetical protein